MGYGFLDIAVTPSVRAAQEKMGADHLWVDFKGDREFDRFTGNEAAFIGERDSFYMASVSENGWPYVQHRGGLPGFVKVIDEKTLAFADYRGNRQYISVGNLAADDRVSLIFMDYARRARLKVFARVEIKALDEDPKLTEAVSDAGYKAKAERVIVLHLVAYDWNCPQHIPLKFTPAQIESAVHALQHRIEELEAENAKLRAANAQPLSTK